MTINRKFFFSLEKNTALRDGLLVFFFVVVPLILFAVFIFVEREHLRRRCFRRKRSQTYESDGKNQANVSRQPVSAPRHVPPVSPPREVPVYANRFPVPAHASRQPPQFPSRPPPPQPKISSQGNLIPARPAPAPPLYSSLTWFFYLPFCKCLQGTENTFFFSWYFLEKPFFRSELWMKTKYKTNFTNTEKQKPSVWVEKYKEMK